VWGAAQCKSSAEPPEGFLRVCEALRACREPPACRLGDNVSSRGLRSRAGGTALAPVTFRRLTMTEGTDRRPDRTPPPRPDEAPERARPAEEGEADLEHKTDWEGEVHDD
jgi:hypothetical protein